MKNIVGSSVKVEKGEKYGVLTGIVYLAPADSSGYNLCEYSTAGCREACLGGVKGAGRMPLKSVKNAQVTKSLMLMEDRQTFNAMLSADISRHACRAARLGLIPAMRLNGTSDVAWEHEAPWVFETFPDVQFYDYTKNRDRLGWVLPNYRTLFSRSEDTPDQQVIDICESGNNVAVVADFPRPKWAWSFPTIDGDLHDYRFADPEGCIIWLKDKGKGGKDDRTGFVLRREQWNQ